MPAEIQAQTKRLIWTKALQILHDVRNAQDDRVQTQEDYTSADERYSRLNIENSKQNQFRKIVKFHSTKEVLLRASYTSHV